AGVRTRPSPRPVTRGGPRRARARRGRPGREGAGRPRAPGQRSGSGDLRRPRGGTPAHPRGAARRRRSRARARAARSSRRPGRAHPRPARVRRLPRGRRRAEPEAGCALAASGPRLHLGGGPRPGPGLRGLELRRPGGPAGRASLTEHDGGRTVSCPACGEGVSSGQDRCPSCGALLAAPSEGPLAPLPSLVTATARTKEAPGRELPGARRKERTWKDEVRDRMRHRRQRREGGSLPLFEQEDTEVAEAEAPPADDAPVSSRAEPRNVDEAVHARLPESELQDLPLNAPEPPSVEPEPLAPEPAPPSARRHAYEPPLAPRGKAEERGRESGDEDWAELPPRPPDVRPPERPALPRERLQAAVVDLGLLVSLWVVVVYFASRAAHVPLPSLRPAWPWLVGYLAFLGLVYSSYFTGTTGQTLGKMVFGLRVLDASSRPPGYLRAFLRAAVGALGILAVGLGQLPMLFDPARRGLADRLLRTRVVRR